jgi:signal recognition particle subunit SRP54
VYRRVERREPTLSGCGCVKARCLLFRIQPIIFERLSDGFSSVFRKLSGKGAITESNVRDAMEEVRTSLLEADVHHQVVDEFCARVMDDARGREVTKSLEPGQEMIGIVHDRLVEFLGGTPRKQVDDPMGGMMGGSATPPALPEIKDPIMHVSPGPTIIMMCGLQGSGKTTTCGKLAGFLKKRGRSVLLAAADLQRPAAV